MLSFKVHIWSEMNYPNDSPDILQRLDHEIGKIHDSESFRRYLDMQARFHRYSPSNVALISRPVQTVPGLQGTTPG